MEGQINKIFKGKNSSSVSVRLGQFFVGTALLHHIFSVVYFPTQPLLPEKPEQKLWWFQWPQICMVRIFEQNKLKFKPCCHLPLK